MSERLTQCKSCRSVNVETISLVNPETSDMNCEAVLRCEDCKCVFNGRVASPHYEKMRERGWII